MKHKVGDIIRVRKDLRNGIDFGDCYVSSEMANLAGKLVTISGVVDDTYYYLEEDDLNYYWIDEFFEDEDDVDKILKEEKKEDNILNKALNEMTKEIIKQFDKGGSNIKITTEPIYMYEANHGSETSIQRIVGTKYKVVVMNKEIDKEWKESQ